MTDLDDRKALIADLGRAFPEAVGVSPHVADTQGGRQAAEAVLAAMQPGRAYVSTRNYLDGAVTRLSPYLRHGVLSLAEVRDAALARVDHPGQAFKFVNELGWRDYFQRVYRQIGDGIWHDREPYKTGYAAESYQTELPSDIRQGTTGLACIDAFSQALDRTGYLHNHARMWTAAYVVHWRRVRWQAGARWFLQHLLDGDPASNNLSWQWVASTFSHKPYFFNRENLERHTRGRFCGTCPVRGRCPFEGSYETLEQVLFPQGQQVVEPISLGRGGPGTGQRSKGAKGRGGSPARSLPDSTADVGVVWVHGDCLSPLGPALGAHPGAPAVWVWDEPLLHDWRISLKRLVFMAECLQALPVAQRRGNVAEQLLWFAQESGSRHIATTDSPSPRFASICQDLRRAGMAITVCTVDPFLRGVGSLDLKRFSRYWRVAQRHAFGE